VKRLRKRPPRPFDRFAAQCNPAVMSDILQWEGDADLGEILLTLQAQPDKRSFYNTYAEALVARHLLAHDCDLRFEVPTPTGKHCDFQVNVAGEEFFLHVKRVNTGRPMHTTLTVSSRLRILERIKRPYVVQVRWKDGLPDELMQKFVYDASRFIQRARIGDETLIRDENENEIGGVRIVAPWEGDHVLLAIGLPDGFVNEAPRIRKLMRKAYQQFMPKAANVIVVCTSHPDDFEDFETALLGTHVERWDALPPRGRRVAHGRDTDGFWYNNQYADSAAVGWFWFRPQDTQVNCRLWTRPGRDVAPHLHAVLEHLFNNVDDETRGNGNGYVNNGS